MCECGHGYIWHMMAKLGGSPPLMGSCQVCECKEYRKAAK